MDVLNGSKLENEVEVDETFVGEKNKNRHKDKTVERCQGRSFKDKVPRIWNTSEGWPTYSNEHKQH